MLLENNKRDKESRIFMKILYSIQCVSIIQVIGQLWIKLQSISNTWMIVENSINEKDDMI